MATKIVAIRRCINNKNKKENMPLYDYSCNDCKQLFEKQVPISKGHDPQECPECKSLNSSRYYGAGAPALGDPVRLGITRPDNGFRDVLRRIHEKTPGSILNTNSRYI